MKCSDIYSLALAFLGSWPGDAGSDVYASRVVTLFPTVLRKYVHLSHVLSGAEENDEDDASLAVSSLNDDFPLDERLADASAFTLASLLILEEDSELSELLEARAEKLIKEIVKESVSVGKIREVYRV